MGKAFRPYGSNQRELLTSAIQERAPEAHPGFFVCDVADQGKDREYGLDKRRGEPWGSVLP